MPRGQFKSRRFRTIFVKAPGGKTRIHYRDRKPGRAHCAACHKVLPGVPREVAAIMRNIPKTAKRPERPYGGILCSGCMRIKLQLKARGVA